MRCATASRRFTGGSLSGRAIPSTLGWISSAISINSLVGQAVNVPNAQAFHFGGLKGGLGASNKDAQPIQEIASAQVRRRLKRNISYA